MIVPPKPADEDRRLAAIKHYKLGGIGREPPFDRITRLAADLFDVPISLVSIVGSDTQCFRGACGLDMTGTDRDTAFCAFAILGRDVMVVPDAKLDPRFVNNPFVLDDPLIRFYAGAPLRVATGETLGTLCLIDDEPRDFDFEARELLAQLAQTVVDLIELRVERFAAEAHRRELADERELLKLTIENVSEGVALFDDQLRLTLWNESFIELFGYPPEMVGEGVGAAELMRVAAARGELGVGDPDQIVAAFVASIRSAASRQLEVQRSDGRILEVRRETIGDGRFIATARDVTYARQMARLKDELVSTVSHELRTPLTAISGALALLDNGAAGELPEKARGLTGIGRKNAERLGRLVDDLLDLDKLEQGRLAFQFAPTDLAQLLAEASEQNRLYADETGVTLRLDVGTEPVVAMVDPARIFQVVTNLVSNACKFAPGNSEVWIFLDRTTTHARISVADQGPGVSAAFRPRLFERFAQDRASHQKGKASTGLGLAICREIVRVHGGEIQLDEAVASGATFRVWLPLAGEGQAAQPAG